MINVVAKMCPATEEYKAIFQIDKTFKKELGVYMEVIPFVTEFQAKMGVAQERLMRELICHCYNGRISLNLETEDLDENALMILENLTCKNFITEDRLKGFNNMASNFILRQLALFHATFIAIRHHEPELFKAKVRKYLNHVDVQDALGEDFKEAAMNMFLDHVCKTELEESVAEKMANILKTFVKQRHTSRTVEEHEECPFSTFVHNDFWTNNMMISYGNF